MQVRYITPSSSSDFEARFESFRITAHSILTRICVQRCKVSERVLNVIEFVVTNDSIVRKVGGGDNLEIIFAVEK